MKSLNDLVDELILAHVGGEKFFDNLDKAVQNENYIWSLIDYFDVWKHTGIIVSGKFGLYALKILQDTFDEIKIIVVNGSLRKGEKIINLENFVSKGEKYLFIDDSFYSGKTRQVIQDELKKYEAEITDTAVVYDGSLEKDVTVKSLYRYYKNND